MTALLLASATGANEWGYVAFAYAVVLVVLVAYVAYVLVQGRRAGRRLPPDERRWM